MPPRDPIDRQVQDHIDHTGWSVIGVFPTAADPADTPTFAYTVGLTEKDQPELAIAGLHVETMKVLLNTAVPLAPFTHGQAVDGIIRDYPATIVQAEHHQPRDGLYPGVAYRRYGRHRVRLQQLVWPDNQGRFPWDDGYSIASWVQPLIAHPNP